MLLIADSGSTKTEWCLADKTSEHIIYSEGINPYFQGTAEILAILHKSVLPEIQTKPVSHIYFYGAGCSSDSKKETVQHALETAFPNSLVLVDHDVMGAARSLCNRRKGIVGILGTGSNTVLFNGEDILQNVPSLGFILGDEGSGSWLGKQLLRKYLYGELDTELADAFTTAYHLSKDNVLEAVYRQPLPNRFLATFSKFIASHIAHPQMNELVEESFTEFISRHVSKYPGYHELPLHCTGSVGFIFKAQLQQACNLKSVLLGDVVKNPLQGLVNYHLQS